ncbi:CLUMA_CG009568, isoform A [Clunio marinus]|uniref:CLUMA_CG009568, isoform A n=1 Tax=Clunio marinus TaxID=568069 RepID=A0A1J1I8U5_9DIPT|nr:CLUMA_CG009568, isoform A [Clunio marinus]
MSEKNTRLNIRNLDNLFARENLQISLNQLLEDSHSIMKVRQSGKKLCGEKFSSHNYAKPT